MSAGPLCLGTRRGGGVGPGEAACVALDKGGAFVKSPMPRPLENRALRAVGAAVGSNPISWLIPCHRVIRKSGMLGGYRWGLARKIAMMGFERTGQGLRVDVAG